MLLEEGVCYDHCVLLVKLYYVIAPVSFSPGILAYGCELDLSDIIPSVIVLKYDVVQADVSIYISFLCSSEVGRGPEADV